VSGGTDDIFPGTSGDSPKEAGDPYPLHRVLLWYPREDEQTGETSRDEQEFRYCSVHALNMVIDKVQGEDIKKALRSPESGWRFEAGVHGQIALSGQACKFYVSPFKGEEDGEWRDVELERDHREPLWYREPDDLVRRFGVGG